eukprot:jgi/Tetstr1/459106/TSEL_004556.t1
MKVHIAVHCGAKLFKLPTVDFETTSFQESTLFGSLSSEAVERAGGDFTVSEDVHNMLDVDADLLPPDDKAPAEDDDDLIDVDEDADGVWESPKPPRRGAVDVEDLAVPSTAAYRLSDWHRYCRANCPATPEEEMAANTVEKMKFIS